MSGPLLPSAALPTPLQHAAQLEVALGCPPLHIKRDDLIGFALAGTKTRALEGLLADAVAGDCDVLVVGGGPSSNLVAGAAVAARVRGLDVVAVLYGHGPLSPSVNEGVLARLDVHVRWTGQEARESVDAVLPEVADALAQRGRRPYVVPRGGARAAGTAATARAADELAGQLVAADVTPAAVLVATGSAGLQAGLLAGAAAGGHPWRVIGVSVSRPVEECRRRVVELARACASRIGAPPPHANRVEVHDGRHPGFGLPSPRAQRVAQLALEREGLVLDPVYTAKALAALPGLGDLDGPVVFWHSGGLPAASEDLGLEPATAPAHEVRS